MDYEPPPNQCCNGHDLTIEKNIYWSLKWGMRCLACIGERNKTDKYKSKMLERMYGISMAQRDSMRQEQDFGCYICGEPETEESGILHIDHCHKSGKVRRMLCRTCNLLVGVLECREGLISLCKVYITEQTAIIEASEAKTSQEQSEAVQALQA